MAKKDSQTGMYDRGTMKVVVLACFIIFLAVVITGNIGYFVTRGAVVDKLKSHDLIYITGSIASKIDDRLERAKETSLVLARDPAIQAWLAGAERDEQLGNYAKAKIDDIASHYDYANSFIVSTATNHYWAEGNKLIQVMSPTDPAAQWFYEALKMKIPVALNIDYNSGRNDTFVFVNALVGSGEKPLGVTGVGLSIKYIAEEFQKYKFGEKSNLWLIDSQGKILLSDHFEQNGKYLNDFVPAETFFLVTQKSNDEAGKIKVLDYQDEKGQRIDLSYQSIQDNHWKIVYQIPRSESIALLDSIKVNGAIASLVAFLLMIFVFYIVAYKIADPLKRAIRLTQEMEKQIEERTQELSQQNDKILDSIDYAKRLQEAILSREDELQAVFAQHFILWKPRDIVGGDFYWVRKIDEERSLVAVIDCTGHGVPGACMTMAVNSALTQIVNQEEANIDPAEILAKVNRRMRELLHHNRQNQITDDGLDMAICFIENRKKMTFAGAKIPLYIYRDGAVQVIRGDNKSIGYQRSQENFIFTNHVWKIKSGDRFYVTTDGYIDQNGGEKDYSFGKKRFLEAILGQAEKTISQQDVEFVRSFDEYRGKEPQRDDITVIGFSL